MRTLVVTLVVVLVPLNAPDIPPHFHPGTRLWR
jgi:hypothetical protein